MTAFVIASPAPADGTRNPETMPTNGSPAVGDNEQTLRSYLRLQEQLHAALLAVEQARLEASVEARTNADLLAIRLNGLERALADQRQQQEQAERSADRTLMILAAVVLGLGLVALAMMTLLQARGINRLAEIALGVSGDKGTGAAQFHALPAPAQTLLLAGETRAPDSDRLLATIGRLENRIHELEHSTQRTPAASTPIHDPSGPEPFLNGIPSAPQVDPAAEVAGLLGKGQTLLQLGEEEKALQCFDEVVARTPDNPDAHLKKGLALERLGRFDDALKCYDRSMKLGRSPTQAFLRKAEILTRQERFAEALECYEQALRAQAKT
jgi:tetratricopeptide (TPR) repeat protein